MHYIYFARRAMTQQQLQSQPAVTCNKLPAAKMVGEIMFDFSPAFARYLISETL